MTWPHPRLATAQGGRQELDRTLHLLTTQLAQRRQQADRWHRRWADACNEADIWLLRAMMLGGQDALRVSPHLSQIDVTWATEMGLRYPTDAGLTDAGLTDAGATARPDGAMASGNVALPPATIAFRAALLAGIRAAAAEEAVRRVEAEIAVTRRRLSALERDWPPQLSEALPQLSEALPQLSEALERLDGPVRP